MEKKKAYTKEWEVRYAICKIIESVRQINRRVSLYDGSYIIPISKNEGTISEATNENERSHEEFQSMVQAIPLQDRCIENPLVLVSVIKDFGRSKRYVMSLE